MYSFERDSVIEIMLSCDGCRTKPRTRRNGRHQYRDGSGRVFLSELLEAKQEKRGFSQSERLITDR